MFQEHIPACPPLTVRRERSAGACPPISGGLARRSLAALVRRSLAGLSALPAVVGQGGKSEGRR